MRLQHGHQWSMISLVLGWKLHFGIVLTVCLVVDKHVDLMQLWCAKVSFNDGSFITINPLLKLFLRFKYLVCKLHYWRDSPSQWSHRV